jgi:hypothetical protein
MIVHEPGQASQIDGERDKVLLNAIVDRALDRAPIGVRGLDQAFPRPMKLGYFALQSIDNLTKLLARARVRHRPTFPGRSVVDDSDLAMSRRSDHAITQIKRSWRRALLDRYSNPALPLVRLSSSQQCRCLP